MVKKHLNGLTTASNDVITVTITDAPTVAQLVTINAATTGAITLGDNTGALSGTTLDLVAAFAGTITEYAGTITVTDSATQAQWQEMTEQTTGIVTIDTLKLIDEVSLDFSDLALVEPFAALDISNIDATDGSANALTLSLSDVLGLDDGTHSMKIDTDAQLDTVALDPGWVQQADVGGYDVYAQTSGETRFTVEITNETDVTIGT